METDNLAANLRKIIADLENLAAQLENDSAGDKTPGAVSASVKELRCIGILEEMFRNGSRVSVAHLPALCRKYGRTFRSLSGYMGGKRASIKVSETDKEYRELTEYAVETVRKYRKKWGEDWLEAVDMDMLGNPATPDNLVLYMKGDI